MNIIEVKNLTKDYGSGRGVFDVSFSVNTGEVFGFLGPNGAGKSTTIRHLMGFSKPDSGETFLFGKPTFEKYSEILSRVGYIPGEIALPTGLTGSEFIRMMQDMQGIHNHERLARMLDMFKVDNIMLKSETKRMSLGEKRKLAVVVAFMHDPEVLSILELDPAQIVGLLFGIGLRMAADVADAVLIGMLRPVDDFFRIVAGGFVPVIGVVAFPRFGIGVDVFCARGSKRHREHENKRAQ